jgi:hypothetical protein
MIIIDALIVAYVMMLLGLLVTWGVILLGIVMIVVGLIRFYDEKRNNHSHKKVAKHTRIK